MPRHRIIQTNRYPAGIITIGMGYLQQPTFLGDFNLVNITTIPENIRIKKPENYSVEYELIKMKHCMFESDIDFNLECILRRRVIYTLTKKRFNNCYVSNSELPHIILQFSSSTPYNLIVEIKKIRSWKSYMYRDDVTFFEADSIKSYLIPDIQKLFSEHPFLKF